MSAAIAKALTIAGSDSSGGAGIQADLKTFMAFGVYGASAVTALTAQNTLGVQAVYDVPPDLVRAQIRAVLDDIGADAMKTGMLSNAGIVAAVAECVEPVRGRVPLVVDPVMVAKSGARLLRQDAVAALVETLLPHAAIVTPNREEASLLSGLAIETEEDIEAAVSAILGMGPKAVLFKGGHWGGPASDDLFAAPGGVRVWLRGERFDQRHTHGTGCALSAAIAACLARGMAPLEACRHAKTFVAGAIRHAFPIGQGVGPVNHMWRLAPFHDPNRRA